MGRSVGRSLGSEARSLASLFEVVISSYKKQGPARSKLALGFLQRTDSRSAGGRMSRDQKGSLIILR